DQRGNRHGDERRDDAGERDRGKRMDVGEHGEAEQQVGAESHERLLPDRHETRIAGEQVPQACERHERIDLGEQAQVLAIAPPGGRRQRDQRQAKDRDADPARRRRVLDAQRAHPCTLGNRPSGLSARMTRNATWPARICQPGSILAPIAWATPRTMPPARVPHRLPSPPMMTASNPKLRRAGPIAGPKLARTARNTPAIATTASESAIASAKTWRVSRPISPATDWSSEVARNARPRLVR